MQEQLQMMWQVLQNHTASSLQAAACDILAQTARGMEAALVAG
jgi:hypothetical protein